MSREETQKEKYSKLLFQVRKLNPEELLLLFIEAKTGEKRENVPDYLKDLTGELGVKLSRFYADMGWRNGG